MKPIDVNAMVTYYGKDGSVLSDNFHSLCTRDNTSNLHSGNPPDDDDALKRFCTYRRRGAVVIGTNNSDFEKIHILTHKPCPPHHSSSSAAAADEIEPFSSARIQSCNHHHHRPANIYPGTNFLHSRLLRMDPYHQLTSQQLPVPGPYYREIRTRRRPQCDDSLESEKSRKIRHEMDCCGCDGCRLM